MECPDNATLLVGLEGIDQKDSDAALRAHLEQCPRCTGRAAAVVRIRSHLHGFFEQVPPQAIGECPDDETLLAYVEGSLADPETNRVAGHLEQCEACFLWVAEVRITMATAARAAVRVPRRLVDRAKRIVLEPLTPIPTPVPRRALAQNAAGRPTPSVPVAVPARRGLGQTIRSQAEGGAPTIPSPFFSRRRTVYALAGAVTLCALVLFGLYLRDRAGPAPGPLYPGPRRIVQLPESEGVVVRGGPRFSVEGFAEIVFGYRLQGSDQMVEVPLPSDERITLTSQDAYMLRFRVREKGWVYVFQVDSSGQLALLFPSARFGTDENPVIPERDYSLPSEGTSFQLDEVVGEETVYVVFSRERRTDWEEIQSSLEETRGGDAAARLSEELAAMAAGRSPALEGTSCVQFRFEHAATPR